MSVRHPIWITIAATRSSYHLPAARVPWIPWPGCPSQMSKSLFRDQPSSSQTNLFHTQMIMIPTTTKTLTLLNSRADTAQPPGPALPLAHPARGPQRVTHHLQRVHPPPSQHLLTKTTHHIQRVPLHWQSHQPHRLHHHRDLQRVPSFNHYVHHQATHYTANQAGANRA
jgi:hypothetical protein